MRYIKPKVWPKEVIFWLIYAVVSGRRQALLRRFWSEWQSSTRRNFTLIFQSLRSFFELDSNFGDTLYCRKDYRWLGKYNDVLKFGLVLTEKLRYKYTELQHWKKRTAVQSTGTCRHSFSVYSISAARTVSTLNLLSRTCYVTDF